MQFPTLEEITKGIPGLSNISALTRGGQKLVYKADHDRFGNIVLKVILSADERTKREIDIVTRGIFPNVPRLYDWGVFRYGGSDTVYLLEQYIPGETLRSYLSKNQVLSLELSLRLLRSLLETAVELEKQKLVHRDIKPENIILGEDGKFWLLDFGIARHLGETSITNTNAPFGPATLGYAAPEQLRNMKKQIDIRADLFSIGVVLYESISGQQPFASGARDQLDVLRRTESVNPKHLTISDDSNNLLSRFIAVLMEKYPSRRPMTAHLALRMYLDIVNN